MSDNVHTHDHCGCHDETPEEILALLKYMLDHNRHHADELYDMANKLDNEAKELVHAAVIDIESSNDKLAKAINILSTTEG